MTVEKLIELLQGYDPNMVVALGYEDTNEVLEQEDIYINNFVNNKGNEVREFVFNTGTSLLPTYFEDD